MSSKTKKARGSIARIEQATFRRFADSVNVCPLKLRWKIAIKILLKKL